MLVHFRQTKNIFHNLHFSDLCFCLLFPSVSMQVSGPQESMNVPLQHRSTHLINKHRSLPSAPPPQTSVCPPPAAPLTFLPVQSAPETERRTCFYFNLNNMSMQSLASFTVSFFSRVLVSRLLLPAFLLMSHLLRLGKEACFQSAIIILSWFLLHTRGLAAFLASLLDGSCRLLLSAPTGH